MNALRRLTDGVIPQAVITGSLSFAHIHDLAQAHGQTGWKAWTYPLSVDLLMVAAYRELKKAQDAKRHTLLQWVWFLLALCASLAANVIATGARDPLSIGVGVWPAIAFFGCTLLGHRQEQAAVTSLAPAVLVDVESAPQSPPIRAVERSAVAALAPAEPAALTPAAQTLPDVPAELLAYAREVADSHRMRHGSPITVSVLRSRLGVALPLATALHTHLTTA